MPLAQGWDDVRRVLAIRLDAMGDVLMTTPALRAIREQVEHVTLLTSPAGAGVAAMIAVDDVLTYEAPWMKASTAHSAVHDQAMIRTLAESRYDAAIVFTVFSQTPFPAAMLAYLAGVPRVLAHCRERGYALVTDEVRETEPERGIRHEVQRHLDLVATVGFATVDQRMAIHVPEAARVRVRQFVPECGPWAVVHPGATAPSRRWPPDFYAAALRLLANEHGWRFVLTGGADEGDLIAGIVAAAGIEVRDLAGQLSLAELAALIDAAPLLISNNTGPAHLAAAVQTPVVDLYALTNPQHTPWQVPARVLSHDVECRWCFGSVCRTGHHLCLRGVTPAAMVAAALDLTATLAGVAA